MIILSQAGSDSIKVHCPKNPHIERYGIEHNPRCSEKSLVIPHQVRRNVFEKDVLPQHEFSEAVQRALVTFCSTHPAHALQFLYARLDVFIETAAFAGFIYSQSFAIIVYVDDYFAIVIVYKAIRDVNVKFHFFRKPH